MQLMDLMFDENDLWGPGGPAELHSSPGLHQGDETAVPLMAPKFFDQEGPTSSSSEVAPSGSSGRDSTTPGASSAAVDPSSAAAGASWLQMAPNMSARPPQSAVLYSVTPQQQASLPQGAQTGWPSSSVQWHSAFSSAAPSAPAASQQVVSKESKGTISHSTIEKQRRDRINSLIDELRDLVPPSAAVKGPDGGDAKRPKHVVLSDTIALLRHLKEKVQQDELERQRLQLVQQQMVAVGMVSEAMAPGQQVTGMMQAGNGMVPGVMSLPSAMEATTLAGAVSQSAQSLLHHSLSGSLSSYTAALPPAAAFGPSSCPELPQAPPNLPSAVGVLVEEGPGPSFLVKVNCRDRHGLLSDITQALCGLPSLQITRAAITTGASGAVYDVFEIVAESSAGQGHNGVTALDVQYHVHQALHKWKNGNSGAAEQPGSIAIGKRQRM